MFKKIFLVSSLLPILASPVMAEGQITGTNLTELGTVLNRLITFLFGIVGGIAIILIVVGGIKYIIAGGDPKATQGAKQTIQFAILGLIIVLLAVVIVNIIGNTFGVKDLTIIKFGTSQPSDFQN